jgi:alpha-1,2-mannosyltransferase
VGMVITNPRGSRRSWAELARWEWLGLVGIVLVAVLFGTVVEFRSAFMKRRMTDLGAYLRAGWAVRQGTDLYATCDDSGWHYNYPPLFAILMAPLADPPAWEDHTGMVPYPISVAVWYVLSLVCLALAVHWLADALEETTLGPQAKSEPVGRQRWWALRLLPIAICLPAIGSTLSKGQVNLLILAFLCAMIAALLRGRSWRAGWWLSWAICIKVFPAFLLLYPVVRRDWRFLAGCAGGLTVGLVLIPLAVFGPARTRAYALEYFHVTLAPGLGIGTDASRSTELTHVTATDSQSLVATLHNTLHPDAESRPHDASTALRNVSYVLGALLTAAIFWAGARSRTRPGPEVPIFLGLLILDMLLLCPVCHFHYFCLTLPLVMGILAAAWEGPGSPATLGSVGTGTIVFLLIYLAAGILPRFPSLDCLREFGLVTYAALLLLFLGIAWLWRLRPSVPSV